MSSAFCAGSNFPAYRARISVVTTPDPTIVVSPPATAHPDARDVEMVERKGRGHPDSICDALAEAFSISLTRAYHEQCGAVLHHNVDKVLLAAGSSAPRFGGGEVISPIEIYLAGRATHEVDGTVIPVAGRSPRIESTQRLARGLHSAPANRGSHDSDSHASHFPRPQALR
jgi:hypothetical protein